MSSKNATAQKIKTIIRNWAEKYYGSQKLENPNWSIELLSKELAEMREDIFLERR